MLPAVIGLHIVALRAAFYGPDGTQENSRVRLGRVALSMIAVHSLAELEEEFETRRSRRTQSSIGDAKQ